MSLPDLSGEAEVPLHPPSLQETVAVVKALVASHPGRGWRTSELVRALPGHRVDRVITAVVQLHYDGGLERVGTATYRHPTMSPTATAAHNERLMWG